MALAIDSEECDGCGACEPLCPNQAISHEANTFKIDFKACTECVGIHDTPQCVLVCPIACIHATLPPTATQTVKRAKLFQQVVRSFNRPDTISFN